MGHQHWFFPRPSHPSAPRPHTGLLAAGTQKAEDSEGREGKMRRGSESQKVEGTFTPLGHYFCHFFGESPQRVRLTRLLELLRLLSGSARRSCGCRCFLRLARLQSCWVLTKLTSWRCLAKTRKPDTVSVVDFAAWDDLVAVFLAMFSHDSTRNKVRSSRPSAGKFLALSLDDLTLWHAELRSSGNIL